MNKKIFLAILIFLLVIGLVSTIRLSKMSSSQIEDNNGTPLQESNSSVNASNENTDKSGGISINQLSQHNKMEDCWIAYQGKVYDITSWLPVHPGGSFRILPYCGTAKEFEEAFTKQHGTKQVSRLMKVGVLIGDFEVVGDLN